MKKLFKSGWIWSACSVVLAIVMSVSTIPAFAQNAISYNYGGIDYLLYSPSEGSVGSADVQSYDGHTADVILPNTFMYGNEEYYVSYDEEIVAELFAGQTSIVSIKAEWWNENLSFRGCSNLTTVILPEANMDYGYEGVREIGEYMFYDCPKIDFKPIIKDREIRDFAFALSEPTELGVWDFVDCPGLNNTVFNNRLYTSISLESDVPASAYIPNTSKVRNVKLRNIELDFYGSEFPSLEKIDMAGTGISFYVQDIPAKLSDIKLTGSFERISIYGESGTVDDDAQSINFDFGGLSRITRELRMMNFRCSAALDISNVEFGGNYDGEFVGASVEIERVAGMKSLYTNCEIYNLSVSEMPDLVSADAKGVKCAQIYRSPLLEKISLPDVEDVGSFDYNTSLKELYIGDKLRNISSMSLEGCTAMSDFIYGGTIEQWLSLDPEYNSGYYDDSTALLYNVPNFWYGHGDAKLTKLTELNSEHLKNIDVIKSGSFAAYKGLTKVSIPASVRIIEQRAFSNCTGLTAIEVNCDTISYDAFLGCGSYKKLTVGNNVKMLASGGSPEVIYYEGTPDSWNSIAKTGFDAGEIYFNGTKYSEITLHCPKYIGKGFSYSPWLNSLMIECGQDTIDIEEYALCESSIKKIGYIPYNGSRSANQGGFVIGKNAFAQCKNLSEIGILNNTLSIGEDAFDETAWLNAQQQQSTLYINTLSGKVVYKYLGTAPENTYIELENGTVEILPHAFKWQEGIVGITLPSTLKNIGEGAFDGISVGKLEIPASVENAGGSNLKNIEEFIIEDSPDILAGGFSTFWLSGVKHIYYGRDMKDIDVSVSTDDSISLTYGKYVTVVNECNYIPDSTTEVHVLNEAPPTCEIETDRVNDITYFTGLMSVDFDNCILYVPEKSIDDYRQADGWNQFKNIRAERSGVESVESDGDDVNAEIYDLSGVRRNGSNLAPGLYIRRSGDKTEKIFVK